MTTAERQTVLAAVGAVPDRQMHSCPRCGRRYAEVFYQAKAKKPSYRCVCIGHGGGCGQAWTP